METMAEIDTATLNTTKHIADPETKDGFKDILRLNDSTRNAGRVWADKSVYTEDFRVVHRKEIAATTTNSDGWPFVTA